jgi:cytochrome oxidase assembly protein ShyY1
LLGLLLASGFAALGRWQLHRAVEKEQMLESVARAMERREARPLGAAAQPFGYDWAAGHGRFLASPVMLLDNQRRGDVVGVHVYLPFQPDVGPLMLVDLGWLALPPDRKLPDVAAPVGEQTVSGLLAPPPSPGLALGPAYTELGRNWLLTRLDIGALSASSRLRLAPRVLRLDPALPLGYPRDLDLLTNTLPPERHRGYALQWFGLALAVVVTTFLMYFRRRRQP